MKHSNPEIIINTGVPLKKAGQPICGHSPLLHQMCFAGKWLQNRLRADKSESRSLLAVDIQGHERGGFCIVL